MKQAVKYLIRGLKPLSVVIDVIFVPLTILAAAWFRVAKYLELKKLPLTKNILLKLGVFPIVDHYYEPQFDFRNVEVSGIRPLLSLDMNIDEQLKFIDGLHYQQELKNLPLKEQKPNSYYFHNTSFQSGDAELYYAVIRKIQPKKIVEIGSGYSTLLSIEALKRNDTKCELICIEPYEMPWLEQLNVTLIRKKVEEVELHVFEQLQEGDILFIDSSHVVRPKGDVLYEIFSILPVLKKGVLIHFHDIFTPYEYPKEWLVDEFRLWNEQYILEAFLSYNKEFKIVAALNFLKQNYFPTLSKYFPVIAQEPDRVPGSIWLEKL
ncbi:class I SAM-dependent methyltransferase [Fulvivirga sp. 29W222]|uniref:Class I SAM-dependent methyltransferase n=1 Tax=Fulvivirga marina TaxID=2494733 RepID=A0A937G1Q5_9BACT|nr:class I SAM-dependent methyltransferase [Fulvivirga marina]MBL6446876.1 class I SAM-dependent methyltransferase [Fulvivirga marina]